ncbi:MAG: DUF6807 family protein [Armatimonadota bacterium]
MKSIFFAILITIITFSISIAEDSEFEINQNLVYKDQAGLVSIQTKDGVELAQFSYSGNKNPHISSIKTLSGTQIIDSNSNSLRFGFGDINGFDFWNLNNASILIEHLTFDYQIPGYWEIETRNMWKPKKVSPVLYDERSHIFHTTTDGFLITTRIDVIGALSDSKINNEKYGFFGLKLPFRFWGEEPTAVIINSEGDVGEQCYNKNAQWITVYGKIGDKTAGVTIIDSPDNKNFPSKWIIQQEGLVCINPFIDSDSKETTIKANSKEHFHFSILIHDKNLSAERINIISEKIYGRPAPPIKQIKKDIQTNSEE